MTELWRARPIIGNLRFDDDQVLVAACPPEAILKQTVPRQALDQPVNLLVDFADPGCERRERQARAQGLRARRRRGAERSQANRVAMEAGKGVPTAVRFERHMSKQPCGNALWLRTPRCPCCETGSTHAGLALRYAGEAD